MKKSFQRGVELTYINYPPLSLKALKEIISGEKIIVHFQPILSARNHSIIGFEGLVRGRCRNGDLIPPICLFDAAQENGLVTELDRLCREKVLATFRNIQHLQRNSLLFINLETSFLSSDIVGSGYLLNQVMRHNVTPSNVIIEIVESRTDDVDALVRFVNNYRDHGLNIALDDVGTGDSNFERISLLRPNIIKVDRSIISGIATNYLFETGNLQIQADQSVQEYRLSYTGGRRRDTGRGSQMHRMWRRPAAGAITFLSKKISCFWDHNWR